MGKALGKNSKTTLTLDCLVQVFHLNGFTSTENHQKYVHMHSNSLCDDQVLVYIKTIFLKEAHILIMKKT